MRRSSILLAAGLCAGLFAVQPPAQAAADMSLTRLDCGTPQAPILVNERFSDTFAYGFPPKPYALAAHVALLGDEAPGAPWMIAGLGVDIRPLIHSSIMNGQIDRLNPELRGT